LAQTEKIPKVSVCVITYNQERFIRQCLQSIVDQKTDFDFEVIVGDDCSTDGTKAIVNEFANKYPHKIYPIFQSRNIGSGVHNYLSVHNAARGKYVAHVDGDDYLLPGKLQRQERFLDQNENFTVVWHRLCVENMRTNEISTTLDLAEIYKDGVVSLDKLLRYGAAGAHSSMMYRRAARRTKTPKFDVLDLFYSLELLESGKGMLLKDVLGTFRVLDDSINNEKRTKVRALCAHHISYFYKRHPDFRKDVFMFSFTNFLVDLLRRRRSSFEFLKLALSSFELISPYEFFVYVRNLRRYF